MSAEQLTVEELSRLAGLSAASVSKARTGAVEPRTSTLRALRKVFTDRGYQFSATNGHVCVCAPARHE